MIPILLLSLVIVYIACERSWIIRKIGRGEDGYFMNDARFVRHVREMIIEGDTRGAATSCDNQGTLLARVVAKGVSRVHVSSEETRRAMEEQARVEVARLEKGISLLATCATSAPLIGFLGTVIGMIQAFHDMSVAGGNIDIALLSRGIYTALVTTVAGLTVGIIGNFAHHHLVTMIDKRVLWLECIIEEIAEIPLLAREPLESSSTWH